MFYVNLFFFYAIIGFFLEEIILKIIGRPYNSGILYGPWTTVYGIASIIMVIVYFFVKKFNFSKIKEKIIYFFCISFILTMLEALSGYLIEITKHTVYWNYENLKFNFGHYIALEISLAWGLLALISTYLILPRIKGFLNKIPKIITYILIIFYVIDNIISCLL